MRKIKQKNERVKKEQNKPEKVKPKKYKILKTRKNTLEAEIFSDLMLPLLCLFQ